MHHSPLWRGSDPRHIPGTGGFLAAPTPAQPGGHQCLQGFMGSQPCSGGTQTNPVAASVHDLVVSHCGEGDAVGALLAPLALLAPHQQRAGALAVHQALPAILLVALQHPTARGHCCCLLVCLFGKQRGIRRQGST